MYSSSLTFSPPYDDDQDPDYAYYNCDVINNRASSDYDGFDPQVRFNETRSFPILKDASKYLFSIVRFTINGCNKDLPMFIPSIETKQPVGSGDINKTIYKVSLTLNKTGGANPSNLYIATRNITWQPEFRDAIIAPAPSQSSIEVGGAGQDIKTRYYWTTTYSHWLRCVNDTLAQCVADLNTAYGAPIITKAPYISYNPTTNLFSIYADAYGFGGADRTSAGLAGALDEELYLFFGRNTYGLFSNFDVLFDNDTVAPNIPLPYLVRIYNIGKLFLNYQQVASPPAGTATNYWVMTQDYSSTSTLWNPVASIVFTSALLPLVNESTGDPVRFGDSAEGNIPSTQSAFQPIITDIALLNESSADYRQFIEYAPTAEYRLASFQRSKQPIQQIDIQVWWKNRLDGQLYPLQMYNLSSVSLKIMFRRRGVATYPHPTLYGKDV